MKHRRVSRCALVLLSGCGLVLSGVRPARGEEPSAGPAVEACQRLASQRLAGVRLLDEDATVETSQDKVGGQPVGTVVSGYGIRQEKTGGPSNVRFLCLLENAEKPVYVGVVDDGPRDAVDFCWDGFEAAEWGKLTQCLENALKRAEADLAAELKKAADQAGQSMDKLSAQKTLQESTAQWTKYRESECDRQQAFVAGRNHPDIGELTCRIRMTADRIADLKFDE